MDELAQVLGLLFPICALIIWVVRKRGERPKKKEPRALAPYTGIQVFGIVGIILFLTPIFFAVLSNLFRGAKILLVFILTLIPLPIVAETFLYSAMDSASIIFLFFGVFYLVKIVWPKRDEVKIRPLICERGKYPK